MKKANATPRDILIEDVEGVFKFYKVWSKKKRSNEPFFITRQLDDLVEKYNICCTNWNITPDLKALYKLISKYQQN